MSAPRHAPRSRFERWAPGQAAHIAMRGKVLAAFAIAMQQRGRVEHVTLEGASMYDGRAYAVNGGWQGIDWSAQPLGDNSAIYTGG